jgi:hypothetical protein
MERAQDQIALIQARLLSSTVRGVAPLCVQGKEMRGERVNLIGGYFKKGLETRDGWREWLWFSPVATPASRLVSFISKPAGQGPDKPVAVKPLCSPDPAGYPANLV